MDKKIFFTLLSTIWTTIWKQLQTSFRYRRAGGDDNNKLPGNNCQARIDEIYGNTVKWNQLLASGRLVDMGLPSGTLWATSNIDITQEDGFAASPFQYDCTMFSWGNIEGHNTPASGTTFDYNWGGVNAQEPWYEGQVYGETAGAALTASFSPDDTYDAARYNLGSLFKMPTSAQFKELIDNCDFVQADGTTVIDDSVTDKRVTVNNIVGIYFKSKVNGNLIFFSASGTGNGSSWNYRGNYGYYWSTSFRTSRDASLLFFFIGGVHPQNSGGRYYGSAVRAVVTPSTTSEVGHESHKFCLTSNHKNIVDLTALEYPNIASTRPTVAAVESWIALNVGEQDYYPYNPGSLVSFKGQSVKSIGFNQWDEQWETGNIDITTGENTDVTVTFRSKNRISVFPGVNYYFNFPARTSSYYRLFYYDAIGNFLYPISYQSNPQTLTVPSNCHFLRIVVSKSIYGSETYNHDICINISDPAKNGIYKPYWEDVLPIDPIKVYGKVNGEGSYVQCFPDGMRSAGSVKDELSKSGAVVKIGSVDLGTLTWDHNDVYLRFSSPGLENAIKPGLRVVQLLCTKYQAKENGESYNNDWDKVIYSVDRILFVHDSSFQPSATGNEFRAAMSGVILYYELATPITYTNLIYSEDGGLTGIPLSKFKYKVDKYSTEELIVPSDPTGAPTSTPIIADITYQYKGGGAEETLWYGVQWNTTNSSPTLERIGSTLRHHTLPIQNSMRRCLLSDSGEVTYLSNEDTDKLEDGTIADLTGESGQVMVEIPSYYIKFETDGDIRRVKISMYNLDGFQLVPKMYISAYEAAMDRTSNKLSSVVNKTTRYRGGNNTSSWDGTYRSLLGMPATNITTTNFRSYARARGNGWEMYAYEAHKSIYWLFCVEYATLNSQAAYNSGLDVSGYHLGGLGNGVTTISSTAWNDYNSYNPLVPCGVTNSLGNHTGIISYSVMASDDSILHTFSVPSYRGIENPFGHVWKMSDGSMMVSEDSVPYFYVCPLENHSQWASSKNSYYTLRGTLPTSNGYAKRHLFGVNGDMVPDLAGGGSTTYMCDYFYITNSSTRPLFFGGHANFGAPAGLSFATASHDFSYASAYFGSRLCYFPVS